MLRDSWISWYDGLSWYDRKVNSSQVWDEARNRKNAFNEANARNAKELENVKRVQQGMTSEEMQGKEKRILSTGRFAVPPKPWIPTWGKIALGTAAVLGAGIVVVKKTPLGRLL